MLTVLVCGGRKFADDKLLCQTLKAIHAKTAITLLVNGGAPGADTRAVSWALRHDVPFQTIQAEWTKYGPAAGPLRNQRMLDDTHPDLIVAFPGGRGTADMVARAKAAGVEIYEVPLPAMAYDW